MLKGIITPTVTVFDNERKVDFKAFARHIEKLISGGVNGILFLGSIGEFFAMTEAEKKEIIDFAIETTADRVPALIGTGGTAAEEVIELSNYALNKGAAGAAVITPYFFQFNQETLYNYYSIIADAVKGDLYIYNFPARSGVSITPKTVYKLANDFENIAGIKDTMDTVSHTRELIQQVKNKLDKDFAVYSGFDEYFLPNLLNGGDGLIGGLSNLKPELFADIYQAYQDSDFKEINILAHKINTLMKVYSVSEPFFPAIKKAADLSGSSINSICKEPIKELSKSQTLKIKEILAEAEKITQ